MKQADCLNWISSIGNTIFESAEETTLAREDISWYRGYYHLWLYTMNNKEDEW